MTVATLSDAARESLDRQARKAVADKMTWAAQFGAQAASYFEQNYGEKPGERHELD